MKSNYRDLMLIGHDTLRREMLAEFFYTLGRYNVRWKSHIIVNLFKMEKR